MGKLLNSTRISKFLFVGAIWTAIPIGAFYLFIDIYTMPTLLASAIITIGSFFGKYWYYQIIRFLKQKTFKEYAAVQIILGFVQIGMMLILVDMLHLSGIVSAILMSGILVILRYLAFFSVKAVE
jgi:putative flippase GtrA|tara:strand:- start:138 stop:512 length:375 start_codon:yes stop_codon:yes gene_type:complete